MAARRRRRAGGHTQQEGGGVRPGALHVIRRLEAGALLGRRRSAAPVEGAREEAGDSRGRSIADRTAVRFLGDVARRQARE